MNLNNLQHALKEQVNAAIKAGDMTVSEAEAIVKGELAAIINRAQILEDIPFADTIEGISAEEMAEYTSRYNAMIEYWLERTNDVFEVVETIEGLRFGEATMAIQLKTKLIDLAKTVDAATKTHLDEILSFFKRGDTHYVKMIKEVPAVIKARHEQKQTEQHQKTDGLAAAR